ncbi:MAG: aspartyl protease family protein [Acidobacteriota bacterium]
MMRISRAPLSLALLVAMFMLAAAPRADREDAARAFVRATRLFGEGKYADAYAAFHVVLDSDADDGSRSARKGAVRSALYLSRFDAAHRDASRLVDDAPDDAEALTLRGDALWASGLFDEADASYTQAVAIDPVSPRAEFGLARSLDSRGQTSAALEHLASAARRAPLDPEICLQISDAYERRFQYDVAERTLQTCIGLLPKRLRSGDVVQNRLRLFRGFEGRQPAAIELTASAQVTLPFRLVDDKVRVDGELNGHHVEFVVDTGADRTAVTRRTAAGARLRTVTETLVTGVGQVGVQPVVIARADTLAFGPLKIRNLPVVIRNENGPDPLSTTGDSFSPQAAGFSMVVDYARLEVTFARTLPASVADVTLPLRIVRLPMVRGLLNQTHPAYFVVDTGGQMISISTAIANRLDMTPPRRIMLNVWGTNGRDRDAFLLPGVDLTFEDIAYRRFGLAVLNLHAPSVLLGFEVGGILGHQFLQGYRVAMDLPRGQLRLQRVR